MNRFSQLRILELIFETLDKAQDVANFDNDNDGTERFAEILETNALLSHYGKLIMQALSITKLEVNKKAVNAMVALCGRGNSMGYLMQSFGRSDPRIDEIATTLKKDNLEYIGVIRAEVESIYKAL
jgi:hypothetical protein